MFSKLVAALFTLCVLAGLTHSARIRKPVAQATAHSPVQGRSFQQTIDLLKDTDQVQACSSEISICGALNAALEINANDYSFVKDLFTGVAEVFMNYPERPPLAALRYNSQVSPISTPLTMNYDGPNGFITKVENSEFTPATPTYLDDAITKCSQWLGDEQNKIILAHAEGTTTFDKQTEAKDAAQTFTSPSAGTSKICVVATKPAMDIQFPEETRIFLEDIADPQNLLVIGQYPDLSTALQWAMSCACDDPTIMDL